jgi:acyl-CoA hydrolase
MSSKTVKESNITMMEMVMPNHTNPQNTIFGGVIMSWVDIAAAMCATKHCNKPVVTVHVDDIDFLSSIKIGAHVHIHASVNYVGRTSMIIGVKVISENPYTGKIKQTTRAYLTFVALDEDGVPTQVPDLVPETEAEIRRFDNAKKRVENRKRLRANLKN